MPKITKRLVDAVQPDSDREVFVWDDALKGFGLRMMPSGAASYFIQYRNDEGRTRRFKIGRVGTLTPEEARAQARDKLVAVAKGVDPAAERQTAREAVTVDELCDWYLKEAKAGTILGRNGKPIKASTLAMDQSRIDTHVKPLLGARAVRGLTIADIEGFQAKVAAGAMKKARKGRGGATTGGPGVAARTTGMLHTILAHARRKGLIATNPADGVRKLADRKRERHLSPDEIRRFGEAMTEAAAEGENTKGLAALRLMLMTGCRRTSEVLGLRWEWVDLPSKCIRYPDTKSNRPQVRPIGKAAADLLASLPRVAECPWVFPADRGTGHFVGVVRVLQRVCERAGLVGVSPHVLRHTFATMAAELGFTELTIKGLLGQSSRGVTQRYIHLDRALLTASDDVAGYIAGLLAGGAEVVSLPERKPA